MKKVYHKNTKTTPKKVVNQPQQQPKKREIAAWILAILMIIWTIGSVLGTIGFVQTCKADTVQTSAEAVVDTSAETVYNDSHINRIHMYAYDPANSAYSFNVDLLSSLIFLDDTRTLSSVNEEFTFYSRDTQRYLSFGDYEINLLSSTANISYDVFYIHLGTRSVLSEEVRIYALSAPYDTPNAEYMRSFPHSDDFYPYRMKLSIVDYGAGLGGVIFQLTLQEKSFSTGAVFQYFIIIDTYFVEMADPIYCASRCAFVDTPFYDIEGLDYSYLDGTEQFSQGFNAGVEQGYDQGYDEGRDVGRDQGYDQGLDVGFNRGYNEGKADGYTLGVAESNDYSFAGFLGAIFDVPVQTFQSLFSFEILGTDISAFLLSLLTVLVILAIIKLII